MADKARLFVQLILHGRVPVGGVVVGDQVQGRVLGCLANERLPQFQRLRVSIVLLALADDLTVKNVQGGRQSGCAVAFGRAKW